MYMGIHVGQKRTAGFLELELQEAVNLLMWMLGPKLRSSGKAAKAGG